MYLQMILSWIREIMNKNTFVNVNYKKSNHVHYNVYSKLAK